MDNSPQYIAKLEARIDVLETMLSTLIRHVGAGNDFSFTAAIEANIQTYLDMALLTKYPDFYLEELRAFAAHVRTRTSE